MRLLFWKKEGDVSYIVQYCRPRKPLAEMMPDASAEALDMMKRLMQFNPDKRPTAEEALQHPYLKR